jgi:hypothetical protein
MYTPIKDARKMNKNNTTIMFGVLFSSMILLATATIPQQQNAHASPIITNIGTTVQAHTGNGFDNGYAKAKYDFANNHLYNDSCWPNGVYCQQYHVGYETAWIQYHCSTGTPSNVTLLSVNKTA